MSEAVLLREGAAMDGIKRRTTMSFMWGIEDVATARRVGSVGQREIEDGENAIHAFERGARF